MDTTDTRHLNPAAYPQPIHLDFSHYPFEVLYNSVKPMKSVPWVIWCSRKIVGYKDLDPDHYDVEFKFAGSQIEYIKEHDYVNCWVTYAPFEIRWAGKMPKTDFDWWSYYIRNVDKQSSWEFLPKEMVDPKLFLVSNKYSGKQLLPRRRLYCSQGLTANDLPIININLPLTQSVLQKVAGTFTGAILDLKRIKSALKKTSEIKMAMTEQESAMTELLTPKTPAQLSKGYYWLSPSGKLFQLPFLDHEPYAQRIGFKDMSDAFWHGWVRVGYERTNLDFSGYALAKETIEEVLQEAASALPDIDIFVTLYQPKHFYYFKTEDFIGGKNLEEASELYSYRKRKDKMLASQPKTAKTMDAVITGLNALVSGRSGKCTATRIKIMPKFRRWVYHVRCTESYSNPAGWTVTFKAVPKDSRFTDVRKMDVFMRCTCPAWEYAGPDYFALTEDYLDGKPAGLATTPDFARFPWKRNFKVCKHCRLIIKLLKQIPNLPAVKELQKRYPEKPEKPPAVRPGLPGAPEPVEEEKKAPEAPKRPVKPVPEEAEEPKPKKRHVGPPPPEPIEEAPVEEEEAPEGEEKEKKPGLKPGLRPKPEPEAEEEVPEEEPTKETPQVKKLREPFQRGLQKQKEEEEVVEEPKKPLTPPKPKPKPAPKPKAPPPEEEGEEPEE